METKDKTKIKVHNVINAPVEKVWKFWTDPEHIIHWNYASDDWHSPKAENDLRVGGKFSYRMEAKDGSAGFDFEGVYKTVKVNERIEYLLGDGRKVRVDFTKAGSETRLVKHLIRNRKIQLKSSSPDGNRYWIILKNMWKNING
jgi:uncharacterized protein YndB with AHSA1/START domain